MNEQKREQLQAEALDAYLTELQSSRQATRPDAVPAEQAAFLNALTDLAEANAPDVSFASQLEARLRLAAKRRATHPRPRNVLQGIAATVTAVVTERMSNVNRRLVLVTASAVGLALILFAALALLNQNRPVVGPSQVAQAPTSTSTSIPAVAPTHTSLPPTATPTAVVVRETRLPTATPTAPVLPTATPTATSREPIVLPALARWQEAGYGGGAMGDPLLPIKTFVLGTVLPESPARMTVYLQREPERLTAAYAAQMAERLGMNGQVYQSLRLASVPNPGDEPFRGYLAVDGAREVMFEHTGMVHYTDRNRISLYEGHWREPGEMPPLEQAIQAAETFLRSAGLLEGEIQIASTGDTLLFYRVLEGERPLVEPLTKVYIWTDGQVGQVQYWPLALDTLAEYPIIPAQEAWEILRSGQPDELLWQYPYRAAEMPPWGEWWHDNPRFWARSYQVGQQVHRFGVARAWFPTEVGGAPFLAMGNLVLTGDVQSLAEYVLDRYVQEQWMYVHVWGEVQDMGEYQALRLEGWEPAEEAYWGGTVRWQDGQGMLITDDGRTIQLPDLPTDLVDGMQVSVSGGQQGDRLEWYLIQEMSYAELPPEEKVSEIQMTVEQVDLVYLALPPNIVPPEQFAELGYRAVQPVWRFRGHSDRGEAFEFYVQAVSGAYVDGRPQ